MKVYKSKLIDENNIKKTYKLGLREFCILLIVSLLCNQALYATDKSEHINNISQNTNVIIGVVTDSQNGDPIIGATIKIKGSTTGAGVTNIGYITAFDGLNPEQYDGQETGEYFLPIQFNFGVRLTF